MNARELGVSLLEVMVAVAIIILLSAAAIPAFHDAIITARRTEAQTLMEQLMQQQERYFTHFNTYIAFSAAAAEPAAKQFRWWSGSSPQRSAYELEGKACDGELLRDCVQLIASPGTARVDPHFKDPQCQQLTLTSTGRRSATGPAKNCWR